MNLLTFGEIVWDVHGDNIHLGGAPLNLAVHTAALGKNAWIVSAVGQDRYGDAAIARAKHFNVNTDYIARADAATATCTVTDGNDGLPRYTLASVTAFDHIPTPDIDEHIDVLAFGTLALRSAKNRKSLAHILNTVHCTEIFTDLNLRAPFYTKETIDLCLSKATICKVSEEELPTVSEHIFGTYKGVSDSALRLCKRYKNIRLFLVTRGKDGAFCLDSRAGRLYAGTAAPANVVSTVGAGDGFSAAFLARYTNGAPIEDCLAFAADVSALVCGDAGAFSAETEKKIMHLQARRD